MSNALLVVTTFCTWDEIFSTRTIEAVRCDRLGVEDLLGQYVRIEARPRASIPAVPHVRRVAPSGYVFTDSALRRQLGIGCITGEGLRVVGRAA
jgi:hypothetical protein